MENNNNRILEEMARILATDPAPTNDLLELLRDFNRWAINHNIDVEGLKT